MKPRYFAIIVAVGLVALVVWWFMQPAQTVAAIAVVAPSSAPKPSAPVATASPPSQTPVVVTLTHGKASLTPVPDVPPPTDDPQADLKTAIPELARLMRAGNLVALERAFTVPGKLDSERIQQLQALDDQISQYPEAKRRSLENDEAWAEAFEAFETQAPKLNDAGDKATYMLLQPHVQDAPFLQDTPVPHPYTFIKVNGKWYRDQDTSNQ